jgi:CHASE1-domain containing sensor protein
MPAAGLRKVVDERLYPSSANGGGLLRREIWVDGQGRVIRYNLAYINPLIHAGDNGRVLGYDSAHGQHHRHYLGKVTAVSLDGFEQIEARFQKEWSGLAREAKEAKRAKH